MQMGWIKLKWDMTSELLWKTRKKKKKKVAFRVIWCLKKDGKMMNRMYECLTYPSSLGIRTQCHQSFVSFCFHQSFSLPPNTTVLIFNVCPFCFLYTNRISDEFSFIFSFLRWSWFLFRILGKKMSIFVLLLLFSLAFPTE